MPSYGKSGTSRIRARSSSTTSRSWPTAAIIVSPKEARRVTDRPGIDERSVTQIWERQAFDPAGLSTSGLRVLFRGAPSDAGGPDYQDAMLVTEDQQLITGDVE